MFNFKERVEIANESHVSAIERLRLISYSSSDAFKVVNEEEVRNYCKWEKRDAMGLVLIALNNQDEAISTLRANVYFEESRLTENNPIFKYATHNFIEYPVLDLTIAATNSDSRYNGIFSVLMYYMYLIHKHNVKSITGAVVKNSITYNTLANHGYEFIDVNTIGTDVIPFDCWTIGRLLSDKRENAINILRSKYHKVINNYPLIIK